MTVTDSHTPGDGMIISSPSLTVLTPAQALPLVSSQLKAFQAAGVLTIGQANSLESKLDVAVSSLSRTTPNTRAACNQLTAFINEVNSLVAEGVLTSEQASQLLNGALGIYAIMTDIPC